MTGKRAIELLQAAGALRAWRECYKLNDDDVKTLMRDTDMAHLVTGYQQIEAGKITSARKAAAVRANGKLGGRPPKVRDAEAK